MRSFKIAALAGALLFTFACSDDTGSSSEDTKKDTTYSADIRWTAHGIPHIVGETYGDAAFGSGYAFAKLNACMVADQVVKVNSKRAYWHGAGDGDKHITSDFFHRFLRVRAKAENGWDKLSDESKALFSGFAAGYNHYIAEVGPAGLPKRCRNAAWVQPIEGVDLLTYMNDLALVASSRALPLLSSLVRFDPQPPGKVAKLDRDVFAPVHRLAARAVRVASAERIWAATEELGIGSNGWALGKDKTTTGKGMVVANPHFPWVGELKFWQLHVTATKPGYDVAGAALYGSPIPNIGFNKSLGWTHTVSKSSKFTPYILKLDPKDPTQYMYDGKPRKMTSREETIEVKQADGSFKKVTRTMWSSHYGPMIAVTGLADWTNERAYTLRDANDNNLGLLDQFLHVGLSKSVAELENVMKTTQANPWVNTIAADAEGNAFYSESNSVPNLSNETYVAHKKLLDSGTEALVGVLDGFGFYVLDGTTSRDEWQVEAGSREPGLVPFSKTPHGTRTDYVANANESYWLSNVAKPIAGYKGIFGKENAVRSLRTRVTLGMIIEKGKDAPAGADGKFTLDELAAVQFNNRGYGADILLQDTRDMCVDLAKMATLTDGDKIAKACAVLDKWDGRSHVGSKGALLWREYFEKLAGKFNSNDTASGMIAVPYDNKDPIGTPKGLVYKTKAGKVNAVVEALAGAVDNLGDANLALDATVGEGQHTLKAGKKMPVGGGLQKTGMFNIASWSAGRDSSLMPEVTRKDVLNPGTGLTETGYVVNYGSSFVMAMGFTDKGPKGVHLLTYSQSSEPDSPYFKDQTERYAKGEWLPLLFSDGDIEKDAGYSKQTVSGK